MTTIKQLTRATLLILITASIGHAAHAQETATFRDPTLQFALGEYHALKSDAPANNEFDFKLELGSDAALSSRGLSERVEAEVSARLCALNKFRCPEEIELTVLAADVPDESSELIFSALGSSRPANATSEHSYDLSTALGDLAETPSDGVVLSGTEGNSFGRTTLVVAVSRVTGEALVIGSGWAE